MRNKLLKILQENKNEFVNGNELAKLFDVSKMAISKQVKNLRNDGYIIESKPNKGYRLLHNKDSIDIDYISSKIDTFYSNIEFFKTIDSTNNYLKINNQLKQGHIVIADNQSEGRGRSNRKFFSPLNSGIYLSILLKPKDSVLNLLKLTSLTAVAVNEAIKEHYPVNSQIKWVNDILIDNKKVSGILLEASLEMNTANLEYLIIGIGINVHKQKFPDDLKEIATSIENNCDLYISRNELIVSVLNNLSEIYNDMNNSIYMDKYRNNSAIINKKIEYTINNKTSNGIVVKIDNMGHLHINDNNEIIIMNSGEIKMI